jgi:hypothetical protein
VEIAAGTVRIVHAQAFPHLGPTCLHLCLDGQPMGVLSTDGLAETRLETAGGMLEILAERVFDMDQTGERADFGGWLRVEAVTAPTPSQE